MAITNTKISEITGSEISTSKFTLPNKKVTLIPIVHTKVFMGTDNHDGLFMYTGAFQVWNIFRDQFGNYKDPLNAVERTYLEKELNADLNVNHPKNYYETFEVKIIKDVFDLSQLKREFDLSNPKDYLSYKLLLTAPDVAPSLSQKDDTPEYRWVMIEKNEELRGRLNNGKMKAFCYGWLNEHRTKLDSMKDILYAMTIGVSKDSTADELENSFINIIESSKLTFLYELLNDPNLDTNILLTKCLKIKEIVIMKYKYYDKNQTLLASTKDQMLEYLASPENSLQIAAFKDAITKHKL